MRGDCRRRQVQGRGPLSSPLLQVSGPPIYVLGHAHYAHYEHYAHYLCARTRTPDMHTCCRQSWYALLHSPSFFPFPESSSSPDDEVGYKWFWHCLNYSSMILEETCSRFFAVPRNIKQNIFECSFCFSQRRVWGAYNQIFTALGALESKP